MSRQEELLFVFFKKVYRETNLITHHLFQLTQAKKETFVPNTIKSFGYITKTTTITSLPSSRA
jgi:hypothetical protein